MSRTTLAVLTSHLRLRQDKNVEQDLQDNFDPKVVLLTMDGEFTGYDGVRQSNQLLEQRTTGATYQYIHQACQGDTAFLVWAAVRDGEVVCRGADSFVIRDGKIIVQTIYYHEGSE